MKTIRLLHVFPTFSIGGSQVRFCDLANNFSREFSHFVVALDGNFDAMKRIHSNVVVDKVKLEYRKNRILQNIILFRKTIREINPDLLLTYNWGSIDWLVANWLWSLCPMIHTEDGFNEDEASGQKIHRILLRRQILSKVNYVVVPSRKLKILASESWKIPSVKIKHIPNGIDISKFENTSRDSMLNVEKITIGTVATIRRVKNINRLIRVFKKLPKEYDVELSIVGNGPELSALQNEAAGCENIYFHGYQKNPMDYIQRMDIFALTSDSEQMPISVVEAMAAGKPIISTDVGDVMNMVSDINRPFVSPCEDEVALYMSIIKLIKDRHLRNKIGLANREKCIQKFSWLKMRSDYEDLYSEALKGHRISFRKKGYG